MCKFLNSGARSMHGAVSSLWNHSSSFTNLSLRVLWIKNDRRTLIRRFTNDEECCQKALYSQGPHACCVCYAMLVVRVFVCARGRGCDCTTATGLGRRVVSAKDRDCLCEGQTEVEVTGSLHSQPP
jgi:hypothetical protein